MQRYSLKPKIDQQSYMIHKLYFLTLFSVLTACTFTENESIEPAYLILDEATLTTKSSEGAAIHKIRYAWVILDGQLLGNFPLPAKVPIIPSGKEMEIQINAGVNFNGDVNSSVEYPFFNPVKKTLIPKPKEEYKIALNYSYVSDIVFDFIEDFENSTHIFDNDIDENPATRINLTSKDKVSGNKSGMLILTNESPDGEFSSIPFFEGKNNKLGNAFLEFDYKSDEPIYIGAELVFKSSSTQSYSVNLKKTDQWVHVYINLTKEISQNTVLKYRVIMGSTKLNSDLPQSEVYFDNVKLVHF